MLTYSKPNFIHETSMRHPQDIRETSVRHPRNTFKKCIYCQQTLTIVFCLCTYCADMGLFTNTALHCMNERVNINSWLTETNQHHETKRTDSKLTTDRGYDLKALGRFDLVAAEILIKITKTAEGNHNTTILELSTGRITQLQKKHNASHFKITKHNIQVYNFHIFLPHIFLSMQSYLSFLNELFRAESNQHKVSSSSHSPVKLSCWESMIRHTLFHITLKPQNQSEGRYWVRVRYECDIDWVCFIKWHLHYILVITHKNKRWKLFRLSLQFIW